MPFYFSPLTNGFLFVIPVKVFPQPPFSGVRTMPTVTHADGTKSKIQKENGIKLNLFQRNALKVAEAEAEYLGSSYHPDDEKGLPSRRVHWFRIFKRWRNKEITIASAVTTAHIIIFLEGFLASNLFENAAGVSLDSVLNVHILNNRFKK
jgi:hypothetical protein